MKADLSSFFFNLCAGTQKIYLKTWGCSHNNSDSEYMAGQLAAYGFRITGGFTKLLNNIMHKDLSYNHSIFITDLILVLKVTVSVFTQ